jgi:hypothetical protein
VRGRQWREWPCLAYGEGENGCAFEPWVHQRARLKGSPSQSKAIPGRGTRRSFDVVFFSSEGSQRNPKCWQKFSAGLGWAGKFAAATKARSFVCEIRKARDRSCDSVVVQAGSVKE